MSRLTFTKEEKLQQQLGPIKFLSPELCAQWEEKLSRYEDMGEPVQLERALRLAQFEPLDWPSDPITEKQAEFIKTISRALNLRFHGRTKAEASEWISDYIEQYKSYQAFENDFYIDWSNPNEFGMWPGEKGFMS